MNPYEVEHCATVLVRIPEPILKAGVLACLRNERSVEVIETEPDRVSRGIDVIVIGSPSVGLVEDLSSLKRVEYLDAARILVITAWTGEHAVREALERGIHGFVLTSSPLHDLIAGVRTLSRGGTYLCPPIARSLSQAGRRETLTAREEEVLRLLAIGLCNKSIARNLDIALGTVKAHVKSIMSKFDASSRTEAASVAFRCGLLGLQERTAKTHEVPNLRPPSNLQLEEASEPA